LFEPYFNEKNQAGVRAAAKSALLRIGKTLPTKNQAVRLLTDKATSSFDSQETVPGAVEGKVAVWHWDRKKRELSATKVSTDVALLEMARRFSRDALRLAPEDSAVRRLYLAILLEAAATENGLTKPLDLRSKAVIE
ncbi:MAG: hypothetical protein ACWGMZ_07875, partial [Thermoguttaceae bacterium]